MRTTKVMYKYCKLVRKSRDKYTSRTVFFK